MNEAELKKRSKEFALRAIRLVNALPRNAAGRVIGGQLTRSATSVASNYRAACCARSRAEFSARMGTVEEEADESAFWLELIVDAGLMKHQLVEPLRKEADELTAIFAASVKTSRKHRGNV